MSLKCRFHKISASQEVQVSASQVVQVSASHSVQPLSASQRVQPLSASQVAHVSPSHVVQPVAGPPSLVQSPDESETHLSPLHVPDLSLTHSSFVQSPDASTSQTSFTAQVCPVVSVAPQLSWVVQVSSVQVPCALASRNRVVLILFRGDNPGAILIITYPPVILASHRKILSSAYNYPPFLTISCYL